MHEKKNPSRILVNELCNDYKWSAVSKTDSKAL